MSTHTTSPALADPWIGPPPTAPMSLHDMLTFLGYSCVGGAILFAVGLLVVRRESFLMRAMVAGYAVVAAAFSAVGTVIAVIADGHWSTAVVTALVAIGVLGVVLAVTAYELRVAPDTAVYVLDADEWNDATAAALTVADELYDLGGTMAALSPFAIGVGDDEFTAAIAAVGTEITAEHIAVTDEIVEVVGLIAQQAAERGYSTDAIIALLDPLSGLVDGGLELLVIHGRVQARQAVFDAFDHAARERPRTAAGPLLADRSHSTTALHLSDDPVTPIHAAH